jgi:hypothetical protein
LRTLRAAGLDGVVDRLPLTDYIQHGWKARVAGVHDRLSTPITHFHDRDELLAWFRAAQLAGVDVSDTDRRGWRASGRRVPRLEPTIRPRTTENGYARHEGVRPVA